MRIHIDLQPRYNINNDDFEIIGARDESDKKKLSNIFKKSEEEQKKYINNISDQNEKRLIHLKKVNEYPKPDFLQPLNISAIHGGQDIGKYHSLKILINLNLHIINHILVDGFLKDLHIYLNIINIKYIMVLKYLIIQQNTKKILK